MARDKRFEIADALYKAVVAFLEGDGKVGMGVFIAREENLSPLEDALDLYEDEVLESPRKRCRCDG